MGMTKNNKMVNVNDKDQEMVNVNDKEQQNGSCE